MRNTEFVAILVREAHENRTNTLPPTANPTTRDSLSTTRDYKRNTFSTKKNYMRINSLRRELLVCSSETIRVGGEKRIVGGFEINGGVSRYTFLTTDRCSHDQIDEFSLRSMFSLPDQ